MDLSYLSYLSKIKNYLSNDKCHKMSHNDSHDNIFFSYAYAMEVSSVCFVLFAVVRMLIFFS